MALVLSGDSGFDLPNGAELAVGEGGTGANNDSDARVNLGLGNVDNVSASDLRDRSTHTGTQPLSTISDAGTIASQDANSVNIDGGTIDGTSVNATTLTASGDVNFDSGTLFVDESTDRVGIGTTSPTNRLTVVGVSGSDGYTSGGVTVRSNGNATPSQNLIAYRKGNGISASISAESIGNNDTSFLAFNTSSTPFNSTIEERMRIDPSGNITAATGGGWVGTVSQSGLSSVIERGSNANGDYVKFADGTMICFVVAETPAAASISIAFNLGFRSTARAQTLPSSFINTDYKIATNDASSTGVFVRASSDTVSTLGVSKFWPTSVTDAASSRAADTIIVGRWY